MKNISILVVEDTRSWQEVYKNLLASLGFPYEITDSSDKAKAKFRKKLFDVAIFDLRLVDWDVENNGGMELVEWLVENRIETKVIICTGYGTPKDMRTAFHIKNVVDFLSKQEFSPSEFKKIINTIASMP